MELKEFLPEHISDFTEILLYRITEVIVSLKKM